MARTNFSADFWTFRNFRRQFREICGATWRGNAYRFIRDHVVPCSALTEQSLLKKSLKMASKSSHKPSHNTSLNYVPPRAGRPSVTYKKQQFSLLQPARVVRSPPKFCMLIEKVVTILKGVNHFSIQRTVFRALAKILIFGHWRRVNGNLPVTKKQTSHFRRYSRRA